MPRYLALLRAVNVGGHAPVRMADLRAVVERRGFRDVSTLLQSGNLVFEADDRSETSVERTLATGLESAFHQRIELYIRSAHAWRRLIAENPFPREATEDPAHLLALVLSGTPGKEAWTRLGQAIHGRERYAPGDRAAYLVYPDGIGRSKLTPAVLEHALGLRGTGRNWNTVQKLAQLLTDGSA